MRNGSSQVREGTIHLFQADPISGDCGALGLLVSDAFLEVSGDTLGFSDDEGGVILGEDLVGGFGKESEPSGEMIVIERKLKVSHHGITFVATRGQQDGGPEVLESGEVMRPVAHDGVKDGADVVVATDLCVEGVYEVADL